MDSEQKKSSMFMWASIFSAIAATMLVAVTIYMSDILMRNDFKKWIDNLLALKKTGFIVPILILVAAFSSYRNLTVAKDKAPKLVAKIILLLMSALPALILFIGIIYVPVKYGQEKINLAFTLPTLILVALLIKESLLIIHEKKKFLFILILLTSIALGIIGFMSVAQPRIGV